MKKRIIIKIIIIIIILGFNQISYGANSVTTSNTSSNIKSTSIAGTSNANLSNLGLTKYDFSGFRPEITSYDTVVPESTESVEVYAQTQDKNATYEVTGNTKLKKGENKVTITVTSADKTTKKEYYINVKRRGIPDKEEEKEEEVKEEEKTENTESISYGTILSEPHTETGWYIVGISLVVVTVLLIIFIIIDDYKPEKKGKKQTYKESTVENTEEELDNTEEKNNIEESNIVSQETKVLKFDEIKNMKAKLENKGKHF